MKQAIKKTVRTKAASLEVAPVKEATKANKAEEAELSNSTKTKLFNRFLEASCDCV
jgi:hypothetical protein